jgi:hypothetical protein
MQSAMWCLSVVAESYVRDGVSKEDGWGEGARREGGWESVAVYSVADQNRNGIKRLQCSPGFLGLYEWQIIQNVCKKYEIGCASPTVAIVLSYSCSISISGVSIN